MGYSSSWPVTQAWKDQQSDATASKTIAPITNDSIRKEFIKRVLVHGGRLMMNDMTQSIRKMDLVKSGLLINSLRMAVDTDSAEYDGRLSFRFAAHGRFQDMGAGRTKTDEMEDVLAFLGKRKRSIKRSPRKWYTRNVYGNMNTIINSLMNGYSENIKASIKQQLEKANQ